MELIHFVLDFTMHIDRHLNDIIQNVGAWSYLLLFIIIFAETGLVVTPFLPGDSLLFAAGALAGMGAFNIVWLCVALMLAAIIGDSVNYAVGKMLGGKVFQGDSKIFKKNYIDKTHRFYEKYGGKTIIIARFIPIVRTFAPFVAGVGKMSYGYFFIYNVAGALLWVGLFVIGGFVFGNIPLVKGNFTLVILVIISASILPPAVAYFKHKSRNYRG